MAACGCEVEDQSANCMCPSCSMCGWCCVCDPDQYDDDELGVDPEERFDA